MIVIIWNGKLLERIEKGCRVCKDMDEALEEINKINQFGEIQFKVFNLGREIKILKKLIPVPQPIILIERYVLE